MPSGDQTQDFEVTSELSLEPAGVDPDDLRPGAVLGQYRLLERIGSGGRP